MRKYWAGIAMFAATIFLATGCNHLKNVTDAPSDEPITFVFYNADGKEDPWTDPVAQEITKATGVTLETQYPREGEDDQISLMIATGEFPDIIFAKGDAGLLIDNNSLIDLSELIDTYGPHIKELYGEDYKKLRYSESDPSIYQLCSNCVDNEVLTTSGTAQIQWAAILANDYKVPTTLEEYEVLIKKYLAANPTIDGQKTIGITLCCSDWHWYTTLSNPSGYIANGAPDNGQWIIDENYNAQYKHAVAGQKEYFQWLNRMHKEGILDSEFATQTYEDYLEKIASGRVIALLDASWNYQEAEQVLCADGKYDRTYAGLPVTLDENVICSALQEPALSVGWGIGITKSCKDPVRAIQFIDWLCTEEGQVLTNWGIEGVNYYYDEDGIRRRTEEEKERASEDVNYIEETGVGLHNYPFPRYGSRAVDSTGNYYSTINKQSVIEDYNMVEKKVLEHWGGTMLTDIFPQADTFKSLDYAPVWSQTFSAELKALEEKLNSISRKFLIQCIVCAPEEFDAEWAAFQEALIEAGREEAEQQISQMIKKQAEFWKSK